MSARPSPRPRPPAPAPAPPPATGGYVNPLAGASVTPERIDQGVDYSGSGTLGAIGDGKVTYVGTSGTGWPGAFVEFQLDRRAPTPDGTSTTPRASRPASGLHVGQTVRAGQPIASINGGIEVGWGSGVGTQPAAQADGQWSRGDDASNVARPGRQELLGPDRAVGRSAREGRGLGSRVRAVVGLAEAVEGRGQGGLGI